MKKRKFYQKNGFTLVEMLIVLLVVSVLLLLVIPNIVNHSKSINDTGCEAMVSMVESQVQAYELEFGKTPSMSDLVAKNYLKKDQTTCPNDKKISIDDNGHVSS